MNYLESVTGDLQGAINSFSGIITEYSAKFIVAILLVVIGWFISKILRKALRKIVRKAEVDSLLRKVDLDVVLERAGYKLNSGIFIGEITRWLVFLLFFIPALNILELTHVIDFLLVVLDVVLKLLIAVVIMLVSVFAARFIKGISGGVARAVNLKADELVANIAAGVVYFMATVTVLGLFNVTAVILEFVGIMVVGLIFALSLAFGLAFGLGGKEAARKYLEDKNSK